MTKIKPFSFIRHFSGLVKIRKSRLQQYNAEQQQKNAASSKSGSKSKSKQKKGSAHNPALKAKHAAEDAAEACSKVAPTVFTTCLQVLITILHFARKNKFIPSSTAEIMTLISPSLRCMSRLNYANFEDEQLDIESYAIGEFVKDYQRKSKVRIFTVLLLAEMLRKGVKAQAVHYNRRQERIW